MAADRRVKEVVLQRAVNEDGSAGSFGFSIMGGAKSRIPAVVCHLELGGPAVVSGQIKIGDQLIRLNDEEISDVLPKDLVEKIRSAPDPSLFALVEDPSLKEKVMHVIRKHEEKRRGRDKKLLSKSSEVSIRSDEVPHSSRKSPGTPRLGGKEGIEIETSVNTVTGEVVRVRRGKIIANANNSSETTEMGTSPSSLSSPPQRTMTGSISMTSEQPSLLSSCSSGSLGVNDTTDEGGVSTSSEVTPGGKVFVVKKQPSLDGGDGSASKGSTPSQTPVIRKTTPKKNGDVRVSLSEEVFVNEINTQQHSLEMAGNQDTLGRLSNSPRRRPIQNDTCTTPEKEKPPSATSTPLASAAKYSFKKNQKDDPFNQAILLARKLYMLDGYSKSEIGAKLADRTPFGRMVAREYLNFFEFAEQDLVECLRQFLGAVSLQGETYDRERVMIHFSEKYFEQNPYSFPSYDAVHGVTCAILLLNSDLHSDHGGSKMTLSGFIANLERIDVRLPKEVTKKMYDNIKKKALESPAGGEDGSKSAHDQNDDDVTTRVYHVTIPGTFVEVELPETAPVFKDGILHRKNEMDGAHRKVPRGKRYWRPYYAYLKGFLLYFVPENGKLNLEDTTNALVVTHCLAMRAADYHKRSSVMRVTTSDWHAFLLQASDINELQEWIVAFNKAAALYSAPPLAAPIGSGAGFQRPTFPLAPTRNSIEQQKEVHEVQTKRLKEELESHKEYKSVATKNRKSADWFEKLEFLQFEFKRFHIYLGTLHSDVIMDFNGPLPTGLVPSPSISTLATTGTSEELSHLDYHRRSREQSPLPSLLAGRKGPSSPIFRLTSTKNGR